MTMDILRKTTIDFITSNEKFLKLALDVRGAADELVTRTHHEVMNSVRNRLGGSKFSRAWTVSEHGTRGDRPQWRIRLHRKAARHWSSLGNWCGIYFIHRDSRNALESLSQVCVNNLGSLGPDDREKLKSVLRRLGKIETETGSDIRYSSTEAPLSVIGSEEERRDAIREFAERFADTMIELAKRIDEIEKSNPNAG